MLVSGVGINTLFDAAKAVGVRLETRQINAKGTRFQVKVNPGVYASPDVALTPRGNRRPDERGDRKYQRVTAGCNDGRRVAAVCWHGFRDFFREIFKTAPEATFRTAMDTWRGSADFEARFRESGFRNVGSQMCPTMAAAACRCPESGWAQ